MKEYSNISPFRFWCQKVLPLIYDDSLSYYELLCKVVSYINNIIDDLKTCEINIDEMYAAFNTLKDYVDNYFTNLNVQNQINHKLDIMAADGTLEKIINENIFNELNNKVNELDTKTTALDNKIDDVDATLSAEIETKVNESESNFNNLNGLKITAFKLNRYGNATLLQWNNNGVDKVALVDGGWDTSGNGRLVPNSTVYPDSWSTLSNDAESVVNKIRGMGITHIDYGFITHYHYDHIGAYDYLYQYDMIDNNTTVILPADVNWDALGNSEIPGWNEARNETKRLSEVLVQMLTEKNVNMVKPDNVTVTYDGLSVYMYNRSSTVFTQMVEWYNTHKSNIKSFDDLYNNFSSIYSFSRPVFDNVISNYTYTECGDVEFIGQYYNRSFAKGSKIIKTPHHSFDKLSASLAQFTYMMGDFYKALLPEIGITQNGENRILDIQHSNYTCLYNLFKVKEFYTGYGDVVIDINKSGVDYSKATQTTRTNIPIMPNRVTGISSNIIVPQQAVSLMNGLIQFSYSVSNYTHFKQWASSGAWAICPEAGTYNIHYNLRVHPQSGQTNTNSWFSGIIIRSANITSSGDYSYTNKAADRSVVAGNAYLGGEYTVLLAEGEGIALGLECDTDVGVIESNYQTYSYLRIVKIS